MVTRATMSTASAMKSKLALSFSIELVTSAATVTSFEKNRSKLVTKPGNDQTDSNKNIARVHQNIVFSNCDCRSMGLRVKILRQVLVIAFLALLHIIDN